MPSLRLWTPAEDAVIRGFGPKISLQRLAVRLNRPGASVIGRARELDVDVKKTNVMRAESRGALES